MPTLMKFSSTMHRRRRHPGRRLLVQHRTAVAGQAAGPTSAIGRRGEEQRRSSTLSGCQCAVIPSQETIERSISGHHGAQESRLRPEFGHVVHEKRQIILGIGLSGFVREGIAKQLDESRNRLQRRRLEVQHAVRVEEQEVQVLLRRIVNRRVEEEVRRRASE